MLTDPLDAAGAAVIALATFIVCACWWLNEVPGRFRATLALPLMIVALLLMWLGQRIAHAAAWVEGEPVDFGDASL